MSKFKGFKITCLRLATAGAAILWCHRSIYAALAIGHAFGCVVSHEVMLYGPITLLYVALAVKG